MEFYSVVFKCVYCCNLVLISGTKERGNEFFNMKNSNIYSFGSYCNEDDILKSLLK